MYGEGDVSTGNGEWSDGAGGIVSDADDESLSPGLGLIAGVTTEDISGSPLVDDSISEDVCDIPGNADDRSVDEASEEMDPG